MHFAQVITLSLPALVAADFNLWSGTCTTGVGNGAETPWGTLAAATDSEKVCDGCSGGTDGDNQTFGNPCNPDCDDPLEMRANGDLIVVNTGIKIGYCESAAGGGQEACNAWNYACLYAMTHVCYTDYCIG